MVDIMHFLFLSFNIIFILTLRFSMGVSVWNSQLFPQSKYRDMFLPLYQRNHVCLRDDDRPSKLSDVLKLVRKNKSK